MKINQVLIEADPPVDFGAGMARAWQRAWMQQNPGSNREQALYAAQQMAVSDPDALTKKFDTNTAITFDQMTAATDGDPKDYKGPIGNVAGSEVDDSAGGTTDVLPTATDTAVAAGPNTGPPGILNRAPATDADADAVATVKATAGTKATDADTDALAKMKTNAGIKAAADYAGGDEGGEFSTTPKNTTGIKAAKDFAGGDAGGEFSSTPKNTASIQAAADYAGGDAGGEFSSTPDSARIAADFSGGDKGGEFSSTPANVAKPKSTKVAKKDPGFGDVEGGGDPTVDATARAGTPTVPSGGDPDVDATARTGGIATGIATSQPKARPADPNALKNKTAFMKAKPAQDKKSAPATLAKQKPIQVLKKAPQQVGKGNTFGDGSNPKVGNLLAKGTTMKTDKDLGMTPTPDRGDFNPAAAPKPKADAAKQAAAARNRAANAEREKREMNANR